MNVLADNLLNHKALATMTRILIGSRSRQEFATIISEIAVIAQSDDRNTVQECLAVPVPPALN
jgi:hypothetical protein